MPIATRGTLASGQNVSLSVLARDSAGNAIPGATVWLQFFPTSSAGANGAATACGKTLGAATSCVADAGGHVAITYTAGDANLGADLIQVQDAAVPTIAPANDSYCYNKGRLQIVPAPIGAKDSLLAGGVRSGAVTDLDMNGAPIAGATIYLSLAQINPVGANFENLAANGAAKARSAGSSGYTALGLTAKPFVTNSQGQVPFFYRTPTALPGAPRTDSLIAADKAVRGCLFSAHYDFLTRSGTRTDRIAGPDRYNTAAAISDTYSALGTTDTVFIATGQNFPDALAGAAIAGSFGSPILLVNSGIPAIVATQLTKLRPAHIVILGGSGVVSSAIATQLHAYAPDVQRYGGADRYQTARIIAEHFYPSGASTVFVATGLNFPDALAGAAIAGQRKSPILLVPGGDSLSSATTSALSALHPTKIVILGGTGVVSAAQANLLKAYAPVARYGGANRYETASLLANAYFPSGSNIAFIATGLNFPDALAGAAAAGALNAPIELVTLDTIPGATLSSLTNVVRPGSIVVLGGTGVVSASVMAQLAALP
ncbi:MAG: cell wall-binding repeat-containing protein [Candidatus Limnocylindrales bacterium]